MGDILLFLRIWKTRSIEGTQNESRPNAPGQVAKNAISLYNLGANCPISMEIRYRMEARKSLHEDVYSNNDCVFANLAFLEVGLSADHIDMVKMRYKKPLQRALEHYHAEEEIRQAALKWKGMPITPHPNPRCTALM